MVDFYNKQSLHAKKTLDACYQENLGFLGSLDAKRYCVLIWTFMLLSLFVCIFCCCEIENLKSTYVHLSIGFDCHGCFCDLCHEPVRGYCNLYETARTGP